MVPLKRVVQTLKAMTGRAVAEATLLAWLLRLHDALADWEAAAVECLLAAPALHVDEPRSASTARTTGCTTTAPQTSP